MTEMSKPASSVDLLDREALRQVLIDALVKRSPASAILAAVICNALIILIPQALKGMYHRPVGAATWLGTNWAVYGLCGLIVPVAGIKLIDMALVGLGLV
jgi:potassium-transporting ATPase ATP-binding subunit